MKKRYMATARVTVTFESPDLKEPETIAMIAGDYIDVEASAINVTSLIGLIEVPIPTDEEIAARQRANTFYSNHAPPAIPPKRDPYHQ